MRKSWLLFVCVMAVLLIGAGSVKAEWQIEWQQILLEVNQSINKSQPGPEILEIDRQNRVVSYKAWSDYRRSDDVLVVDEYILQGNNVKQNTLLGNERYRMFQTADGGYLGEGREPQSSTNPQRVATEILSRKLDGNYKEKFVIGHTSDLGLPVPSGAINSHITCTVEVSDGYLLIGVETTHSRSQMGDMNIIVFKLDFAGNLVRELIIPTELGTWVNTGFVAQDGSIILYAGRAISGADNRTRQYLMRMDKDGNKLSEVQFPGEPVKSGTVDGREIAELADGSLLILHKSYADAADNSNAMLTKIDKDFNILWQKQYPTVEENGAVIELSGNLVLSDGKILLYGGRKFYGSSREGLDDPEQIGAIIIALDQAGDMLDKQTIKPLGFENIEYTRFNQNNYMIEDMIEHNNQLIFLGDANAQSIYSKPWFGRIACTEASGIGTPTAPVPPATGSDDVHIYIDGQKQAFEDQPVIVQGRTLLPMRALFQALGADVAWDGVTNTAIGFRDGIEVRIPIGSTNPTVNGKPTPIQVPAQLINSRTYIPLRFVGEALGDDVQWNGESRSVIITKK